MLLHPQTGVSEESNCCVSPVRNSWMKGLVLSPGNFQFGQGDTFITSLNTHSLSAYYAPDTVLGTWQKVANKTKKFFASWS